MPKFIVGINPFNGSLDYVHATLQHRKVQAEPYIKSKCGASGALIARGVVYTQ